MLLPAARFAQLVECQTCNPKVARLNPETSSFLSYTSQIFFISFQCIMASQHITCYLLIVPLRTVCPVNLRWAVLRCCFEINMQKPKCAKVIGLTEGPAFLSRLIK